MVSPESARFTAEDVERLKKLIEEKAEMRREGLLKQRRPVIKIELEDVIGSEEAGVDMESAQTPELKLDIKQELETLEIKQEFKVELEPKQRPRLKPEIKKELEDTRKSSTDGEGWRELDQMKLSKGSADAKSSFNGEKNHYEVPKDNMASCGELLKKSGKKLKKLKLKMPLDEKGNWEVSPLLPNGWKFHQSLRVFRTFKGEALQSYSKALQHMMVTEGYSDEQMDNLQRFIEEKDAVGDEWNSDLEDMEEEHHIDQAQSQREKATDERIAATSDTLKTFQKKIAQRNRDLEVTEESHHIDTMKEYKTEKRKPSGGIKKPSQNQTAQSETPVKTEAITDTVKKNISPNSSKQDGLGGRMGTPSGRRRGSSGDLMSIVHPTPTLNTVLTLSPSGLQKYSPCFSHIYHPASGDWQSSPTIPRAWKVKNEGKGKAEFFLSPDGSQLPSRRAGLQLLVKEGSPEAVVEEMRSMLRFEGYQSHKHLPENWLIRYVFTDINNSRVSILNQEGEEFKSFLRAQEFMQADPRYDETHVEQIKLLVEEKAVERRLKDPAWRKDSTVPKGWKLRVATDPKAKGEKEFLLSKDGRQFPGRRVALRAMVEEGWDSVKVEEMRQKLKHEGWVEEEGLPENWFTSSNDKKGSRQFVTETGERLQSAVKAALWLRDRQRGAEVCFSILYY